MTENRGYVPTVCGPVAAADLGPTLMHEHLLADLTLGGAGPADDSPEALAFWNAEITLDNLAEIRERPGHNRSNLLLMDAEEAVAELAHFRAAGGGCIVDATTAGIGRSPAGLRRISQASGIHVVMGSGYYLAPFHPAGMASVDVDELADAIIRDLTQGCDGVVAGLIGEIGLSWPTEPGEERALRAAVRAQRETGAPVSVHPGRHPLGPITAARIALDEGADPARTIIDHLDGRLRTIAEFEEVARTGCYLEIDLFGLETSVWPGNPDFDMPNDGTRVRIVRELVDRGYSDRLLVSSDMGMRYHRRRHGGWGYDHILRQVVPLMLRRGVPQAAVDQLLVQNPARVLTRAGWSDAEAV